DRNELRDRLVRVKDDFAVAEGNAIACAEGDGVDDLDTIDERSIDAAAVAHVPRPAIENDLGVPAREEAVFDRDRAVGSPPQSDRVTVKSNLLRRDARLIDRESHPRLGFLNSGSHCRKRAIINLLTVIRSKFSRQTRLYSCADAIANDSAFVAATASVDSRDLRGIQCLLLLRK